MAYDARTIRKAPTGSVLMWAFSASMFFGSTLAGSG